MPPKLSQHSTSTSTRPIGTITSLGRTLIASLSLLVLFASWLPHDHEALSRASQDLASAPDRSVAVAVTSGPSPVASVTSDDVHHTHSSQQSAEDLPCTLCRNAGERKELAAFENAFGFLKRARYGSQPLFRESALKPDPHARASLGRAPPLVLAS